MHTCHCAFYACMCAYVPHVITQARAHAGAVSHLQHAVAKHVLHQLFFACACIGLVIRA
jgi:hypothetical protein